MDGKSRTRALSLAPVPRLGPIFRAMWLPVKAFLFALWHSWLPRDALDFGLREAHERLVNLEHPWSSIRGPFSALWATPKRVGITATSATSWTWPDGAVINPSDFCPVTIQELVYRAVECWQFAK
eukprot:6833511-Pyramimonas_sp.AAC.1